MASTLDPRFLGTWRLVGVDREEVATGKKLDEDLKQTGYISYTPDGRMMVIISHVHPDGKEDITCYSAQWHVEGDHVVHDVDIAARAPWKGTKQLRGFRFEGDRLTLSPPVSPDFVHGSVTRRSLTWRKVAANDEEAVAQQFYGTWRLIGVTRFDPQTGKNLDEGVTYDGVIAYTPDRRVTVIITRQVPGKERFITNYAARWSLGDGFVVHHVDIGVDGKREGSDQVRKYRFEGDVLTLTPPISPDFTGNSTERSLIWKRIPRQV
jgi:hypothetical protein